MYCISYSNTNASKKAGWVAGIPKYNITAIVNDERAPCQFTGIQRRALTFETEAEADAGVKEIHKRRDALITAYTKALTGDFKKCGIPRLARYNWLDARIESGALERRQRISRLECTVEAFPKDTVVFKKQSTEKVFGAETVEPHKVICSSCGVYIPFTTCFQLKAVEFSQVSMTICPLCFERAAGVQIPVVDKIRKDTPELYETYYAEIMTKHL